MPFYYAGYVKPVTGGGVNAFAGSGFQVQRQQLVGSYDIILQPTPGNHTPITTVTPFAPNTIARIVFSSRAANTNIWTIEIEIMDITTGQLVDSDFMFITIERS